MMLACVRRTFLAFLEKLSHAVAPRFFEHMAFEHLQQNRLVHVDTHDRRNHLARRLSAADYRCHGFASRQLNTATVRASRGIDEPVAGIVQAGEPPSKATSIKQLQTRPALDSNWVGPASRQHSDRTSTAR